MDVSSIQTSLESIDKVRSILQSGVSGGFSKAFYADIVDRLPCIIILGNQSAGKNAILDAISSGIKLPDNGPTWIAINIILRREKVKDVSVTLKNNDGGKEESIPVENGDITSAVTLAQSKAAPLKCFSDKQTIVVTLRGPEFVNATLVDLPGFTDDENRRIVKNIITSHATISTTTVLHVIRADHEHDTPIESIPGLKSKPIVVLTHCHLLENLQLGKAHGRLQSIISKCSEPRFAMIASGDMESPAKEMEILNDSEALATVSHSLEFGMRGLTTLVADGISKHLERQIPQAREKVRTYLSETEQRLEIIAEKAPFEVLMECRRKFEKTMEQAMPSLENDVRVVMEGVRRDIQNFRIRSEKSGPAKTVAFWNPKYDELEVGYEVIAKKAGAEKSSEVVPIVGVSKDGSKVSVRFKDGTIQEKAVKLQGSSMPDELWSVNHDKTTIVDEILDSSKACGLRNLGHIDRQGSIDRYASRFSNHYQEKLQKRATELFNIVKRTLDNVFADSQVPAVAAKAIVKMQSSLDAGLAECQKNASASIARLSMYNRPPLAHTFNESNYNRLVSDMMKDQREEVNFSTEMGLASVIYYQVLAFIKVQKSVIIEAGTKELEIALYLGAKEAFTNVMTAAMGDLLKHMKEPSKLVEERKLLSRKQAALQEALQVLDEVVEE